MQSTSKLCNFGSETWSINTGFNERVGYLKRSKPLLTRSEGSSSDFVSVYFQTQSGQEQQILIPPMKGITLSSALSCFLGERNLRFAQIAIKDFDDNNSGKEGFSSLSAIIDETTELEILAGKRLVIVEKEPAFKKSWALQKAASFGARTRPYFGVSLAFTEDVNTDPKVLHGKQQKHRWSGLFGIRNPHQSKLCEMLNNFAKHGVPQNKETPQFLETSSLGFPGLNHQSWRDIVRVQKISENDIKVQTAVWELVTTEIDYIHALQTVTNLFVACLDAVQKENLLTDIDKKKLFSNIADICEVNQKFWTLYLRRMVLETVSNGALFCLDYLQPGFLEFATIFSPYKIYCAEQSTCQFYCKELNKTNVLFTTYLAWCESQKMCNRLRLADILVRPMQRLTKYNLLLSAIKKHICDENERDIMDSMIHSVENFVCSVNSHLMAKQENEALKAIMCRIESYDIVDSSNDYLDKLTKQYSGTLDLCSSMKGCPGKEGRHILMDGHLKFKDNLGKLDAHCFLLTDILLICKNVAKKVQGSLKVTRQPYLTDRLVTKLKDNIIYCVYLNEFHIATTNFILQSAEAKNWHEALSRAKHIYSRLKIGSVRDKYVSPQNNFCTTGSFECTILKNSPGNISFGSRVSSLNNSHSGSFDLKDSKQISVDFETITSLSSDDGSSFDSKRKESVRTRSIATSPLKFQVQSSNQLGVEPLSILGQSLPNLNLSQTDAGNNTLLVPGTSSTQYGNVLQSPNYRGISFPPPSPPRAILRRGLAFSRSIKNPPLIKTRRITSESSFNMPHSHASGTSDLSYLYCNDQQTGSTITRKYLTASNLRAFNESGM